VIKSLAAALAIVALSGAAVAREAEPHRRPHRHPHTQRDATSSFQPQPSPVAPDVYWSPAGGNPVHYGQTTGFYAGR
jgi:hypothetical protein